MINKLVGALVLAGMAAGPAFADGYDRPHEHHESMKDDRHDDDDNYWRGFYVGVNAGYGDSSSNTVTNTGTGLGSSLIATGIIPSALKLRSNGTIFGGQIGYNAQSGHMVYGIEADFDRQLNSNTVTFALSNGSSGTVTRNSDWLATFRGRIGYTVMPSVLAFATGGLAVGETKIGSIGCFMCNPPGNGTFISNSTSQTSAGYVVGGGLEFMIAPHMTLKSEYLFVDLGSHGNTTGIGADTVTSRVRNDENIFRTAINFKF